MQGLELILILLAVAAAGLRHIADRVSVPFPTLLVLGGLILAVTPDLPRVELNTDAVAVTSITRRLGVPRVVVTILDGEGLLNDATAFVAYRMAVASIVAGTSSICHCLTLSS